MIECRIYIAIFISVGFEPNATMHTAHHMLLYGCSEPGTNDPVWYILLYFKTIFLFFINFNNLKNFNYVLFR